MSLFSTKGALMRIVRQKNGKFGIEKVQKLGRMCKLHCMEFYDKINSCLIIILNMSSQRITNICEKWQKK
jgi:hypothetical protein